MVIPKIQALEDAKAKVAHLERQVAKELHSALASLPDDYGFESVDAFVRAVKNAAGVKRGRPAKAKVVNKGKRGKITAAIRSKVKKLVKAGKTGAQIAKVLKISVPSVQNIKKAAGLVRTAKKSARKANAPVKHAPKAKVRKKRASPKKASTLPAPPGTVPDPAAAPPA